MSTVNGSHAQEQAESSSKPNCFSLVLGGVRRFLGRMPSQLGGISLAGAATGTTMIGFSELFEDPSVKYVGIPFLLHSLLFSAILLLRVLVEPNFLLKGMSKPKTISSWGAFAMGLSILSSDMASFFPGEGAIQTQAVFVWVCGGLQFVILLTFLYASWAQRCWPEPLWFPPTTGFALFAMTGEAPVGVPRVILELTFWSNLALTMGLEVPIVSYRVLRHPGEVAQNPTVNILMAPVSLLLTVFSNMGGSSYLSYDGNLAVLSLLLGIATILIPVTLYSVYVRRKAILSNGFDVTWSAFSFSAIVNVNGVIGFANWLEAGTFRQVLKVWSLVYTPLAAWVTGLLIYYTYCLFFRPSFTEPPKSKPPMPGTGSGACSQNGCSASESSLQMQTIA